MMITEQNKSTPSDNPDNPANSPSAEARTHGFWGGPLVIVDRPEPSSLADVPSGRKTPDEPTGKMTQTFDSNLTIIDGAGYTLSARSTLRLKGGAGGEDGLDANSSAYNTPAFQKPKRKRVGDYPSPKQGSLCPHATDFEKYSDEVSEHIGDIRKIIEDMVTEAKVARRWQNTIGHQLDEILISNNRLARASF